MRRFGIAVVATVLFGAFAGAVLPAAAQMPIPISLEARLALSFPRGAVAERWGTGLGYGVEAAAQFVPHVALYAGYSRSFFDLDFLDDMRAHDSGFAVGVKGDLSLAHFSEAPIAPWLATGLLLHAMEIRGTNLPRDDRQLGFEVGAGLAVRASRKPFGDLPLVPGSSWGLRYRRYEARVLGSEREAVSYLSVTGALSVSF